MKTSPVMIFEYAGMLGVPALLVVIAILSLAGVTGALWTVLLSLVAAGCAVYGLISVRQVYGHARRKPKEES
ncbi:MAG TPA: hypothetical protein VFI08_10955 [Spirochaetia bacterium]|nr:hypothetical protein [Spirochaetia bacterium]